MIVDKRALCVLSHACIESKRLMFQRPSAKAFRHWNAIAVLACTCLVSCAENSSTIAPKLAQQRVGLTDPNIYRFGVGDKIKLTVFGEPDLSGTFEVNSSGQIPIPLVGDVTAKGSTLTELRETITRRLADGYLKNPKLSLEIQNYRPIYVHGEVKTGGEFVFKNGLKFRDAVAMAGGYTYRANQNFVLIAREGESKEIRVDLPSDLRVLPGDNIRVPERFF